MLKYALIIALLLVGCDSSNPKEQNEPNPIAPPSIHTLDWDLELDQPIRQIEEVLDETEQQQPMNFTSANLGFMLDAKLYFLFDQYLQELDHVSATKAIEEQQAWLDERKTKVSAAYDEYRGGSLASYAGNTTHIEATKDRIDEIQKRLDQIK